MKTSDITVVFQGAFKPYIPRDGLPFAEILKRTRNSLPGARILLSAWEDSDVPEGMGVDDVVLSKDPGALAPLKLTDNKVNNVNRQIVSTRAGMKAVRTRYAVKLRTDCFLEHAGFIDYFQTQLKRDAYRKRIVSSAFFTLDTTVFERIPYHVSDWFQFAEADVLRAYWSAPLMTPQAGRYYEAHEHAPSSNIFERRFRAEYAVEQHIAMHYARQLGYVCPTYLNDISPPVLRDYERFLARETLIIDPWQIGLVFPKYQWIGGSTLQRINNIMHLDWLALARQPSFDEVEPDVFARMMSERRRLKRVAQKLFAMSEPFHGLLFETSRRGRFVRRQAMRVFRTMQRLGRTGG